MGDNLIDLSIEDLQQSLDFQHENIVSKCKEMNTSLSEVTAASFSSTHKLSDLGLVGKESPFQRRESLENNPFDCILKLANQPYDPFEFVASEACFKKPINGLPPTEVKIANLLSLSDDNFLNDNIENKSESILKGKSEDRNLDQINNIIYCDSPSLYNTAPIDPDISNESPPIYMSAEEFQGSSSGGSVVNSSNDNSGMKNRKSMEHRKRLLKLSISNSTFNSPVSRREQLPGVTEFSEEDTTSSPFCTTFNAINCSDHMLASESPLKLVDDDLLLEEPPHLIASENKFDADLEMLKIPILKELRSLGNNYNLLEEEPEIICNVTASCPTSDGGSEVSSLDSIRAKLRAKRKETNNNENISDLIQSLKFLICDTDVVNNEKKKEANCLLESLNSALTTKENLTYDKTGPSLSIPIPQPIIRQGTFDIDLKESDELEKKSTIVQNVVATNQHINHPQNTYITDSDKPVSEIPNVMIESSATYDGETVEEKMTNMILPEVDPFYSYDYEQTQRVTIQSDVNEIVEQLSKLLEQHQNTQQLIAHNSDNGNIASCTQTINPTFIVVMNNTQQSVGSTNSIYNENLITEPSSESVGSNSNIRRRSQSLSIHDKIKIVQLPLAKPNDKSKDKVAPLFHEITTPIRPITRRNSFSSGTPLTPRHSTHNNDQSTFNNHTMNFQKGVAHRSILETHHESEHPETIAHTLKLPNTKLNLKRRMKSITSTNSIMKSQGPMKATIPVKKVLSFIKPSSSTTPEKNQNVESSMSLQNTLNASMQLLTKCGKISRTSTPMPTSRTSTFLNRNNTSYSNICTTPILNASPLKRLGTGLIKPRYSVMSTTPITKPTSSSSVAAGGLKRRTIADLKVPMSSNMHDHISNPSSNTKQVEMKSSLKSTPNNVLKAGNKTKATCLPSNRIITRKSFLNSSTTSTIRNKENKKIP